MATIDSFLNKYSNYKSTFKDTSYDKENSYYLCKDESQEVIDFDKIIEDTYTTRPKSFDAVYIDNSIVYCIEFKNQKPSKIDNKEIQEKLLQGKRELIKLFNNLHISTKDLLFKYIVVYKNCDKNFEKYKCGVLKDKIEFGLEKYKNSGFVKDVVTSDVSFFTRAFKLKFKKELMC